MEDSVHARRSRFPPVVRRTHFIRRARPIRPDLGRPQVLLSHVGLTCFGRQSLFNAKSDRARHLHGWVGGFGGRLGESWVEAMSVSLRAMSRKGWMLGGRTSSRSCRPPLPCRFKRAWVLTILFTYRSCTLSWTVQTRY